MARVQFPQHFKASLDTTSKIITALVLPLITIMPVIIWLSLRTQQDKSYEWMMIAFCILLPLIFLGVYIYAVKGYSVTQNELVITRVVNDKVYAKSTIKSVQHISKKEMGLAIRMMGNGGFMGYTGYFTNKLYGRMQWFVTNTDKFVVIHFNDGKIIVVSPDDTQGFLKCMQA